LAWAEVKQDPRHRIRIQTRLRLYDELIGDMDTSISQLVKAGEFRFPRKTPGLKRLGYLGIITVEPLFLAWEQEMDRIVQMEPEMEDRDFAYHALQATMCRDPNEPGWNKPRDLPIERDKEKALAFWRQWLFERVPDAATVDLDQLDKIG
jgi:hypothetical protein